MRIDIKGTKLKLTPSLKRYVMEKFSAIEKLFARFERGGERTLFVEVARTTKHHRHGDVFYAEATLDLPGRMLRVEEYSDDVRSAIDRIKDRLKLDLKKYREKRISKVGRHQRRRREW